MLCFDNTQWRNPVNIVNSITELYCRIDDALPDVPQHSQAVLSISEAVTIGIFHAVKNVSRRRFRRLETQACWTGYFLAQPTILGVDDPPPADSIELGHPVRSGRNIHQVGKKGQRNQRWITGGKLCIVLNQWGQIVPGTATPPTSMTRPSDTCWLAAVVI